MFIQLHQQAFHLLISGIPNKSTTGLSIELLVRADQLLIWFVIHGEAEAGLGHVLADELFDGRVAQNHEEGGIVVAGDDADTHDLMPIVILLWLVPLRRMLRIIKLGLLGVDSKLSLEVFQLIDLKRGCPERFGSC